MANIDVLGIKIAYEVFGSGDRTAVITIGGRNSKDSPGVQQLAEFLAEQGMRVLVWDRPNCGDSDVCFLGESEWTLNADVLAALLRKLCMAPALLIGVSAGARISMQTIQRNPGVARGLVVLWLSNGPIVLSEMVKTYYGDAAFMARAGGMEAVLQDPWWKESIRRNPSNRDRLLSLDVDTFVSIMDRWARALLPADSSPVVGMSEDALRAIDLPALVFNSSPLDVHHLRSVTERLAALLPASSLTEPPWGSREWYERTSDPAGALFKSLPMLGPQLLDFDRSI